MADHRLFSQKEIQGLLKKATELQKKDVLNKNEEGLTLEEIEQIAADSGIDPVYIREALAGGASASGSEKKFHILGAPISIEVGREVPETMSPEEWEQVVHEARRTLQKSGGIVQKLGNSLEWESPDKKFILTSLTATPSKDRTRFFISSHFGKVAFLMYYIVGMISMITIGGILSESNMEGIQALIIFLTTVVTVFTGTRLLFSKWVQAHRKKMENMISRFEIILQSDSKAETSSAPSGSISFPDEEEQEENTSQHSENKTRS